MREEAAEAALVAPGPACGVEAGGDGQVEVGGEAQQEGEADFYEHRGGEDLSTLIFFYRKMGTCK